MKDLHLIRMDDLVTNPTPRVPVCLCLDTSGSMAAVEAGSYVGTGETIRQDGKLWQIVEGGKSRIQELQKGIEMFFEAIRTDILAADSAEISIVTFDNEAKCLLDFANIERQTVPQLHANGLTAMGEGVNLALDLLAQRKKEYQDKGVDYYQPWLVLMSDGEPNGDPAELGRAAQRVTELVNAGKLTVFPIGIGGEPGMDALAALSPKWEPLRLDGLKFQEFFAWLSSSIKVVSNSTPGDKIKLDVDRIKDWSTLS